VIHYYWRLTNIRHGAHHILITGGREGIINKQTNKPKATKQNKKKGGGERIAISRLLPSTERVLVKIYIRLESLHISEIGPQMITDRELCTRSI